MITMRPNNYVETLTIAIEAQARQEAAEKVEYWRQQIAQYPEHVERTGADTMLHIAEERLAKLSK